MHPSIAWFQRFQKFHLLRSECHVSRQYGTSSCAKPTQANSPSQNDLGKVPQVAVNEHHGVVRRVVKPCRQRQLLPEVTTEIDDRSPPILLAQVKQHAQTLVGAAIIYIDDFKALLELIQDGSEALVKRLDHRRRVTEWRHH